MLVLIKFQEDSLWRNSQYITTKLHESMAMASNVPVWIENTFVASRKMPNNFVYSCQLMKISSWFYSRHVTSLHCNIVLANSTVTHSNGCRQTAGHTHTHMHTENNKKNRNKNVSHPQTSVDGTRIVSELLPIWMRRRITKKKYIHAERSRYNINIMTKAVSADAKLVCVWVGARVAAVWPIYIFLKRMHQCHEQ